MSPDFRYHIASLAAIFLALGVGILIGTAFVGAPVVNRQTRLIGSLEANVNDLRKETAERQQSEEALRELLPGIVKGKLAGKRVLVIQTGSYADAADDAADSLRLAGAIVERITLPADNWLQPADGDPPTDDALASDARQLAPLLAGADNDALADFRSRGLIAGDAALGGIAKYVVLVGGVNSPAPTPASAKSARATSGHPAPAPDESTVTRLARTRDLALAASLQDHGATVVGAEPFDAEVSFMRVYQGAGEATVDAIDRAVGKIALPFALLGEKGNYGMKPTADRVLPPSLDGSSGAAAATQSPSPRPAPLP